MLAKGSEAWICAAISTTALLAGFHRVTNYSLFLNAAYLGTAMAVFMVWFFRDPERKVEVSDNYMISPADGTVIDIRGRKICIFMFLQNVHVNRTPISGRIKEVVYKKGGYLPAFCKDSERNERNEFVIISKHGDVSVTQIAGTIARRIVTYSKKDDFVEQGQRIGMIRFGSRVDVTIPEAFDIAVRKGERVFAGRTVIATLNEDSDVV